MPKRRAASEQPELVKQMDLLRANRAFGLSEEGARWCTRWGDRHEAAKACVRWDDPATQASFKNGYREAVNRDLLRVLLDRVSLAAGNPRTFKAWPQQPGKWEFTHWRHQRAIAEMLSEEPRPSWTEIAQRLRISREALYSLLKRKPVDL